MSAAATHQRFVLVHLLRKRDGGEVVCVAHALKDCIVEIEPPADFIIPTTAKGRLLALQSLGPFIRHHLTCETSNQAIESGMPLADALKSPKLPVYVVHGGDHFTVL